MREKFTYTPEEQEYVNKVEQGVVTPYTPSVTLEDFAGHGPAMATDSPLGGMEAAMKSMRILGGGKPFCPDGYYNDPKDSLKRYWEEKKPLFFDDVREKEWLENSRESEITIHTARETTKEAILQAAVQGKYEAPAFVELRDALGQIAKYHAQDATWKPYDGESFESKVRSLLPAQKLAGNAASKKQKATA